jgi:hypothetical protein
LKYVFFTLPPSRQVFLSQNYDKKINPTLQLNYVKAEALNAAVIHNARELVKKTRPNFDNK